MKSTLALLVAAGFGVALSAHATRIDTTWDWTATGYYSGSGTFTTESTTSLGPDGVATGYGGKESWSNDMLSYAAGL
jgi:hypothetical protein